MPWLVALLALGGLALAAGSSKGGSTVNVNPDLVRAWAAQRGIVAYPMGPGWDPHRACFSQLTCGTVVDVIVDAQGRFWRPDPMGTGKCSPGDDLKREYLAWLRAG